MSKQTITELDAGQLDFMWNFLQAGMFKSNVSALKENCDLLRQAMIQKTGGCRENDPAYYTKREDIGTIINCIVIEAMALYLSGDLDKLEEVNSNE